MTVKLASYGLAAAATLMSLNWAAYGQQVRINDRAPDTRAIALAAEILQLGRAAETCRLLDIAAGPDTNSAPALFLYGECHLEQGDMVSAEHYFAMPIKPARHLSAGPRGYRTGACAEPGLAHSDGRRSECVCAV